MGHLDGAYRRIPNVAVKLSGLVTEADWEKWTQDELAPYVERALEWFGAERVLFGSDWPVSRWRRATRVFGTYRSLVEDLAPRNIEDMLGANAARVYGLAARAPAATREQAGEAWVRHRRGRCDREGGEARDGSCVEALGARRRAPVRSIRNVDRVAELASEHDVELGLAYYGLASFEPPSEEELERTYEHVFAAAETLGVTVVASMSGFDSSLDWAQNLDLFARRFRALASLASDRGQRLRTGWGSGRTCGSSR